MAAVEYDLEPEETTPETAIPTFTDADLDSVIVDYDPEAKYGFDNTPVPDDTYLCRVKLGKQGVEVKAGPDGRPYLKVPLQLQIQETPDHAEFANRVVFDQGSTMIGKKGTSKIHDLLIKIGAPAQRGISLRQLREHIEGALASEPYVYATTKWEASAKNPQDGKYKTVARGMGKFPKDRQGNPDPLIQAPWGEVLEARATVQEYLAPGEA